MVSNEKAGTLFNPLGFLDHSRMDFISIVCGFVLPRGEGRFEAAKLEAAFRRAADKWRVLAGRVEPDEVSRRSDRVLGDGVGDDEATSRFFVGCGAPHGWRD